MRGLLPGMSLLATNAILMQFVTFSAFFLDGYALAAETLVGNAVGGKDRRLLNDTLKYVTESGVITALVLGFGIYLAGPTLVDLLTNVDAVRHTARTYIVWAVLAPAVSLWCYLLDGVFIGATRTQEMRNAMIISLAVYLLAWYLLTPLYSNHGLWLSLYILLCGAALSLAVYLPRLIADTRAS